MLVHGHVQGGVIVADEPVTLPEGAAVRIEVLSDVASAFSNPTPKGRQGGQWNGQVVIAGDFDDLPDEIAEAFGMKTP